MIVYQVRLASGKILRVTKANLRGDEPKPITWDERSGSAGPTSPASVLTQ